METYEVSKKVMGSSYDVRAPGADLVIMTVRKMVLRQGEDGAPLARLQPNFWGTKATVFAGNDAELAHLAFPSPLSLKGFEARKKAALHIGDRTYRGGYVVEDRARAVTGGRFRLADDAGEVALEIAKELSLAHRFVVRATLVVQIEVAILAAVAVDQRFMQMA